MKLISWVPSIVCCTLIALNSFGQADSTIRAEAEKGLSKLSGEIKIQGLHRQVRVLRDKWGVAHIYAEDTHDLFTAQGFVAAQDRLFQMELWKRSGQGRLAEVLGPGALLRDVNARLLRYRGDMKAEYESYSPDTEEILEAFTTGINSYIESSKGNLPIEFRIAGFKPEPWKPEDCLNRMAAFAMTGNSFSELKHAQTVAAVGAEKASRLFDFDPGVQLDPAPGMDFAGFSADYAQLDRQRYAYRISDLLPKKAVITGRSREISQKAVSRLLANDPHRVIAEPSLRYIVHLVAPGWNVIGAGEPGLPGVALGHNQHIAWGFTIFGLDQQDLYLEKLNPADPLQYKTAHGWAQHACGERDFRRSGRAPVTVELKWTRHGPVLWEDGKRALALRWVGANQARLDI